jgi:hypothetical protein
MHSLVLAVAFWTGPALHSQEAARSSHATGRSATKMPMLLYRTLESPRGEAAVFDLVLWPPYLTQPCAAYFSPLLTSKFHASRYHQQASDASSMST